MWKLALLSILLVHVQSEGIGLVFSGAGGRIGQHIGLAETLITGSYPGGKPLRPSYLSGASSGAISSVLVNAIIESQETHRIAWNWTHVKELLFALTTSDIIDDSDSGMAKIPFNLLDGYVLDNTPMVNFLGKHFQEIGYLHLRDLYIPTAFSIMNMSSGNTVRIWSDDPFYGNLSVLEVVVASAAIPVAFPPRYISGLGNTLWIDGGTGTDSLPVNAIINRPEVTSFYILCYGSALTSGGSPEGPPFDEVLLLKYTLAVFNDMRVTMFTGALEQTQAQKSKPAYSYIPSLNQTFTVFDFDHEKLEYTLASDWARQNAPKPLNF